MYKEAFTQRQIMAEPFYEYHHFCDESHISVEFHEHSFYEIYFFISGNVNYIIEGRTYKLRPGDILLTNNSDIHRPEILPSKQPYERIVFWLDEDFFSRLRDIGEDLTTCFKDAARRDYRLVRLNEIQVAELMETCNTIERERMNNQLGNRVMAYAAVIEMIVLLSRAYYETPDSADKDITENPVVNNVIAYISEHLSDDLTLDQLSEIFFLSKYHLSRLFKDYTGLSLYQYIMKKRLTVARNMLQDGENVTNACMKCGFNDYSNFLKAFKREFGRNPSEFINKNNIFSFSVDS